MTLRRQRRERSSTRRVFVRTRTRLLVKTVISSLRGEAVEGPSFIRQPLSSRTFETLHHEDRREEKKKEKREGHTGKERRSAEWCVIKDGGDGEMMCGLVLMENIVSGFQSLALPNHEDAAPLRILISNFACVTTNGNFYLYIN